MSGFEIYVHPEADAGKAVAFGITGDGSGDSPSVAYNRGALQMTATCSQKNALNGTYYLFYESDTKGQALTVSFAVEWIFVDIC